MARKKPREVKKAESPASICRRWVAIGHVTSTVSSAYPASTIASMRTKRSAISVATGLWAGSYRRIARACVIASPPRAHCEV